MSVDCDEVRMALGAYALGALDPREAAEVYEHLGWCPFCRVEADEFLGLPALLGRVTEADIEQASRPPRAVLERMFPDAVIASAEDAAVLGLNAVCDGRHVVLNAEASGLALELKRRGYDVIPVDLSELRKAGGGPKCCTLEIRS